MQQEKNNKKSEKRLLGPREVLQPLNFTVWSLNGTQTHSELISIPLNRRNRYKLKGIGKKKSFIQKIFLSLFLGGEFKKENSIDGVNYR